MYILVEVATSYEQLVIKVNVNEKLRELIQTCREHAGSLKKAVGGNAHVSVNVSSTFGIELYEGSLDTDEGFRVFETSTEADTQLESDGAGKIGLGAIYINSFGEGDPWFTVSAKHSESTLESMQFDIDTQPCETTTD